MAKLLFKLNNVPDDEADDIRQVLDDKQINYYETSAGNWGLSFAAIWLQDEQDFPAAKSLIDEYQQQRYQRVSSEREALIESGEYITLWQRFTERPIRMIAVAIFVVVVLYFSIMPFFGNLA